MNDPLEGFTARKVEVLGAVILTAVLLMAAGLSVKAEEELLIVPRWMWVIDFILIGAAMLLAVPIGRQLPITISRYTGRPSTANMLPFFVLIFGIMLGHALLWGTLYHLHYHLHLGQQATLQGKVLASGRRHGKAAHRHGAWIDLQMDGIPGTTHLESGEIYPIDSDDTGSTRYFCSLEDTKPGDTLQLQGRKSVFGFAVMRFIPLNDRLLHACDADRHMTK